MKLKKTYKFAIYSALYIAGFATALVSGLLYWFFEISWMFILLFFLGIGLFTFLLTQYRVERFIYRSIQKIYKDVSMIDSTTIINHPITTDMATLTEQVKKFATDKKLEIETLKLQEEYRREFLGNVSHELKTPLFLIQGYLLTLLDGAMNDKSIRKKYLQRAEKGVERLIYIVQDLDMITKLEVGDLNLNCSHFDILEVIENVFELLEMRASKKNIILMFDRKYSSPIMVYADQEKIQQVITNLIVNSIKYGKQDGTTEISIENLTENKILIRVMDDGEGIAKQHIPRLFERFYRVDKSGARKEGGSGLGLAIVKHIIEAHDEKIFVKSELKKGSEFSFTLEKAKENI
jgi:two-component system phosphate regulon sensor histidine kinase PhoR